MSFITEDADTVNADIADVMRQVREQVKAGVFKTFTHFYRDGEYEAPLPRPNDLNDDKKWADRYDHPKD